MKFAALALALLPLLTIRGQEVDVSAEEEQAAPGTSATEDTLEEMEVVGSRIEDKFLETPGTVTRIDQQTMVETGVQDLASAVKYDPTVVIPFDMTTGDGAVAYGGIGAASINIRGIEGNRIGIDVDGIRQPPEYLSTSFDAGAESGSGGMGRDYFDPSMFQLVEVVKGGAGALYSSDSMGGAVSFKTLNPADLYADKNWGGLSRLQFFSSNDGLAWQLGAGGKQGPFEYMLLYSGRDSNETSNNGHIPPDPMTMSSDAWLGKVGYTTGDHIFRFTFEHYQRDLYADMRSAIDGPIGMFNIFQKSIENWQDVERTRLSAEWVYEPLGKWLQDVKTLVYWQNSTNGSRNVSTNPPVEVTGLPPAWGIDSLEGRNRRQWIDFETEIYGVNSAARINIADTSDLRYHLITGIDASIEESSNRFDRIETRGRVIPGAPPTAGTETINFDRISFAPSETLRSGLFFQNNITFRSRWDITPGIRFDYHQIEADITDQYMGRLENSVPGDLPPEAIPDSDTNYQNFAASPSIDVTWHSTDNTRLYAGYAMNTRNPTAEELTMVFDHPAGPRPQLTVPNPDLEAETGHAFKIGYKGQNDLGRFAIETFYTRYYNFIENNIPLGRTSDGSTDLVSTANRGTAQIYGIEGSGEWDLGASDPRFDGFSIGLNAGYTIGDNLTIDQPINTVEPWKAIAYIGYADPDGKFGSRLIGTYTGAVTRTDDTTMNGEYYHPDAWFTLDLVGWWKPLPGLTLNAGINNLFDEQYWNWSTVRRGGGHLGLADFGGQAGYVTDRTTAPGRNFFVSATYQF